MLSFQQFCHLTESTLSEGERVSVSAQPWGAASAQDAIHATYYLAADKAQQAKPKLEAMLKRACSGQAKVLVGIKSMESFVDKAVKRGRGTDKIFDMLRAAVLTDDDEQSAKVVHNLRRMAKFTEIEYKDKGADVKFGYYGSYHIGLVIDDMVVEVQVMTRRLWTYKSWAHEFYTQFRSSSQAPDPAILRKSKMVFAMGNRMPQ